MRTPLRDAAVGPALMALALAGCARSYVATEDLVYDTSHAFGTFDYYEPQGDMRAGRPAVLAVHGGAWRSGDKGWGAAIAAELCPSGYVVFSVNYRLSSRKGNVWPAQIEDVQAALRYVRANAARFRIDPARIASLGFSAGGHLATMVALRPDPHGRDGRVDVAVNLNGEHDLTMPPDQVMSDFENIGGGVLGHPAPWSRAELTDLSTVTFARAGVSVLTIHGVGDDNVYYPQAARITAALEVAGADARLVRVDGDAGFCHEGCWRTPAARRALHEFLDSRLQHDGTAYRESARVTSPPPGNVR